MVKHTQTILSVFDRFMKLALKGLISNRPLNQFYVFLEVIMY